MKPGDTFLILETESKIILSTIQDRVGKVKIDKPIYHFDYIGGGRKGFTTYQQEALKMVAWKRWKKL